MATKKVKGQKVDLAALMTGGGSDVALPSAPDPNSDPNERRRRPELGGRGDRRGDDWSRDNRGPDRSTGGFGGGSDFGGRNRNDGGDRDDSWRRGPSQFGFSRNRETVPERPEHMRLRLDARSSAPVNDSDRPASDIPKQVDPEPSGQPEDKWSKVFSKSSAQSSAGDGQRSGDWRNSSSRSGGFGQGGRDREGSSRGGFSSGSDRFGERPPAPPSNRFGSARPDDDVDPRFAGKFGGGQQSQSAASQTASSNSKPALVLVTSSEASKAEEEKKAAKAAKAAERAEAERKAKEAKEAAAEQARAAAEAERAAFSVAAEAAAVAYATGKKGDALTEHVKGMEQKPSGAALVAEVLSKLSDPLSIKWTSKAEYGAVLKQLIAGDIKAQTATLFAIQAHYNAHKFPKIDVKGKATGIIEVVFKLLYSADIVEHAGLQAWADDDNEENGKLTAVVQTTSFFLLLNEEEDGDGEEEEEEEEIDAPRQTI